MNVYKNPTCFSRWSVRIFDKGYADIIKIIGKIDSGNIDEYNLANPIINGKEKFKRIAIRREINEI